jgi:hypothetical protein
MLGKKPLHERLAERSGAAGDEDGGAVEGMLGGHVKSVGNILLFGF